MIDSWHILLSHVISYYNKSNVSLKKNIYLKIEIYLRMFNCFRNKLKWITYVWVKRA